MRLGLLADIHEHTVYLRTALERFAQARVDRVVVLGDVAEMGERLEETCALLVAAQAIGVWGNHDYGLCLPTDAVRQRYSPRALEYMATLRPRLVIEDCYFAHVEPWLDPESLADLWYFDYPPGEQRNIAQIFQATPHRIAFAGHVHRWSIAKPSGVVAWNAQEPLSLADDRYFVTVHAVCEGACAVFDTAASLLIPIDLR